MGIGLGAGALSTFGQTYSASQAQGAEADYRRSQLELNRQMADIQAKDAIARGDREAEALRARTKKLIGSQRAALAAQGIEVGSGSALDVQADTAALGAVDELTIRNNAWREAFGYRTQALGFGSQGALAALAARNQQRQTILTGGLNFATGAIKDYRAYRKT